MSGSFRPWPVNVQTTVAPSGNNPAWLHLVNPATEAAEAGSQKTPSSLASAWYASRISSSVTIWTAPEDSSTACSASFQLAGLPIRMAVATVWGCSITWPRTIGAAPWAWKPIIFGHCAIWPAVRYSLYPFQYAEMLPALPTGRQWYVGARPNWSQTSRAAVFWPSRRKGFNELTSSNSSFAQRSLTIDSA